MDDRFHDEQGRFRKGWPGGPGRPPKKVMPLDLRLTEGTVVEALARLAQAVEERRVTPAESRALANLIKLRLEAVDAVRIAQGLDEVKAKLAERKP